MFSCCSDILLFFYILSTKREREKKRVLKQFFKRNDRNLFVSGNVFTETQSSLSSIKEAQGVFLQVDRCCRSAPAQAFVLQPCTLLSPANQVTYHSLNFSGPIRDEARLLPVLLPTIRWTKKSTNVRVDYELQKAPHGHKDVFPVTLLVSTSQAKERSSDRSPV